MTTVLWILAAVTSAIAMMAATRFAVGHAVAVAEKLRLPPFLVGVTLVALGTDTPEIVNSVVSSYLGHGDINVGDSIGSVFTQGALVLGLVPFLVSSAVRVKRREVLMFSALTIVALGVGAFLFHDGGVSRVDAAVLLSVWAIATVVAWRYGPATPPTAGTPAPRGALLHAVLALLGLAAVGGAAAVLVQAIMSISAGLGVPEYVLSFFGAAVATSLPELAVEFTALRKGHHEIALGDVLGSCLIDASLSVAVGPLLFPTAITAALALQGAAVALATMVLVGALIGIRGKLDRAAGAVLLIAYLGAYFSFM